MRARCLVACAWLLAGCLEPDYQACGDELCPEGTTCLANGHCAASDAVAACSGMADGAPCTTPEYSGACSGGACAAARCGDGVVEGSEQCDGSVAGVDCYDYGFDLGAPTCNDRCDLDVTGSCVRFGWNQVSTIGTTSAWTDGTRLAVMPRDKNEVDLYSDLAATTAPIVGAGFNKGVTGNANVVIAWDYNDNIGRSTDAFVPVPNAPGYNNGIIGVALGDDDTIYALFPPCEVDALPPAGTWSVIHPAGTVACTAIAAGGGAVVIAKDAPPAGSPELDRWTGGSWTTLAPDQDAAMLTITGDEVLVGAAEGVIRYVGGVKTVIDGPQGGGTPDTIAKIGSLYYMSFGDYIDRADGAQVYTFVPPIVGLGIGTATTFYMAGAGLYAFSGTQYTDRLAIDFTITDIALLGDGYPVVATEQQLAVVPDLIPGDNGWISEQLEITPVAVAGHAIDDFWVTDGEVLQRAPTFDDVTPAGFTGVTDLYAPLTGEPELYAVGADALTMTYNGSTWSHVTPPSGSAGCALAAIDGSAGVIYAAGACGDVGIVWQLAGSTWTEVYRGGSSLTGVAATSNGDAFAIGAGGGVRSTAGTWTALPVTGETIAATTDDDVFVSAPGVVRHWDGMSWSRLGVTGATDPHIAAAVHEVYIAGVTNSVLIRP